MKWAAYPKYKTSGVECLGEVPEGWQVKRLKHVIHRLNSGVSVNSEGVPAEEDEIGILKTSCVYGNRFDPHENKRVTEIETNRVSCAVARDSLIISRMNTPELVGNCGFVEKNYPHLFLPDRLWISSFSQSFSGSVKFFWYLIVSQQVQALTAILATGTSDSMKNLTQSDFLNISFAMPSPAEQSVIVDYLDRKTTRIDRLIDKKRSVIEKLKEKRSALISLTVTNGLPPEVAEEYAAKYPGLDAKALAKRKFRPSGVDWLGDVPEGWSVLALKRTWTSCEYGISESLSGEGPVKVLTMGNIQEGSVLIPEEGCLDQVAEKMRLKDNDLLFNRTNSMAHVGKVGLYRQYGDEPVTFASYLVRLRTNERIIPEYLNFLLNTFSVLELARSLALPSINQANLNPTRYGQIVISFPPIPEQKAIVHFLDRKTAKIDRMIGKVEAAIAKLSEYRTALITAAVTGKIDVRGYKA